jgi:hypothetical protein
VGSPSKIIAMIVPSHVQPEIYPFVTSAVQCSPVQCRAVQCPSLHVRDGISRILSTSPHCRWRVQSAAYRSSLGWNAHGSRMQDDYCIARTKGWPLGLHMCTTWTGQSPRFLVTTGHALGPTHLPRLLCCCSRRSCVADNAVDPCTPRTFLSSLV